MRNLIFKEFVESHVCSNLLQAHAWNFSIYTYLTI